MMVEVVLMQTNHHTSPKVCFHYLKQIRSLNFVIAVRSAPWRIPPGITSLDRACVAAHEAHVGLPVVARDGTVGTPVPPSSSLGTTEACIEYWVACTYSDSLGLPPYWLPEPGCLCLCCCHLGYPNFGCRQLRCLHLRDEVGEPFSPRCIVAA